MKKELGFSITRAKILSLLKDNPMTISKLSEKMELGRTTIYHHLNTLKKWKLITEAKEKDEQGQPVMILTNKANPLSQKFISVYEKFFS
jgi:predicted transcriptional regulator